MNVHFASCVDTTQGIVLKIATREMITSKATTIRRTRRTSKISSNNSLTEIDYETDPRRFSEAAKVKGQQVSVLVDAGSMISTINEELVEDMALKKDDENEVWIEYGNATKEVARQSVSIHLNIGGNDFVYKLLVVKRQNVPIILGMDFFVETNLLLDPVSKSFIQWVKKLMQGIAKYRFYSWLSMDTVSNCLKL
ncbi:hypothetical protein G6F64_013598 [Rhizopus arrhizus]|uniref:Peptidase A2 domain-containing protein n=1 Tax=Rhizopus oryzae TaxID=64495 RepID=A0A9P6WVM6_RHIOR|nr:hypothetical protein G6F64_013598 [Rhizopus arrhizus]